LVGLIIILYFTIIYQAFKTGPTITSELLTFSPKDIPNVVQNSPDDGFPTSIGETQLFDTYDANGKGSVQNVVGGNLPNNTSQNLKGILYDRGNGCQSVKFNSEDPPPPVGVIQSISIPDVLSPYKIGLITSDTNCLLATKINNSMTDGDTAIIFILQSNVVNEVSNLNPNDYEITIFTINKPSGKSLLEELQSLYKSQQTTPTTDTTVLTVTLSPYRQKDR